ITFTWYGGGPNKPAINFLTVRGGPFEPANTIMSCQVPHQRKVLTLCVRTSWKSRGGPIMGDSHGGPNKPAINFQTVRGGPFEPANTIMSCQVPHRRKVLTFRVRTSWKSRRRVDYG
ncbi:hypothetical protein SFRURICE_010050, partial [Spodoptera frugiperda]